MAQTRHDRSHEYATLALTLLREGHQTKEAVALLDTGVRLGDTDPRRVNLLLLDEVRNVLARG